MQKHHQIEFNQQYEALLKEAFSHFIEQKPYDYSGIRSEIYQSWVRSQNYLIQPDVTGCIEMKDEKAKKKLIQDNAVFIEVAKKHLKKIYDVIRPSGYYIFISDKDGWLLDIISDEKLLSNFEYDASLVVGASRHERYVGTNAIGTCLFEKKPMVFWGEEHYNLLHKKYTCAGAPVRRADGQVIGCISITGLKETYQEHTLGIVISVVDTIEAELKGIQKGKQAGTDYTFDHFIGGCDEIIKLISIAKQVAKTDVPILLWGESGSGKEVLANAIHNESNRAEGPFVAINCGAIPKELIESELFGYEEGAFTGAKKGGMVGTLEAASGGTLFLDEVESMPLDLQVKLLRVLSAYKITRIGSTEEIPVDFRVISASKCDLFEEAQEGNFREDLNFRINTITLKIPPLRERGDDITVLTNYYLDRLIEKKGIENYIIPEGFYELLASYEWRGNVRELKNVLEGIVAMTGEGEELNLLILPERIRRKKTRMPGGMQAQMKAMEADTIIAELKKVDGNISAAAKSMGMSRSTLHYKIKNNPTLSDYLKK